MYSCSATTGFFHGASRERFKRHRLCVCIQRGTTLKLTRIIPNEEKVAGFRVLTALGKPWITGFFEAGSRKIPALKTKLSLADQLGAIAVRCNIGRNRYVVLPGLYCTGRPDPGSPVLVTANYKLSLDSLRKELAGIAAWILVLDTKGINVWCAAGKGSFGTKELAGKIKTTKLGDLVAHRRLVLPQFGAVGVSAPDLAKLNGYRISWGPVRAADLPTFLEKGMKKDDSMRRVDFRLVDRLKLVPVELVQSWPVAAIALILAGLLALPAGHGWPWRFAIRAASLLGIWLTGAIGFPVLLPYIPGLSFSVKGAIIGLVWGLTAALLTGTGLVLGLGLSLVSASVVSYLAMNFTGSTTFTSQSGALLEVDKAIIPQMAGLSTGLVLGILAIVTGQGGWA